VPFRLLKANEAETIEALGETIVPIEDWYKNTSCGSNDGAI
jgi:hypothetical protein